MAGAAVDDCACAPTIAARAKAPIAKLLRANLLVEFIKILLKNETTAA
jgi:hypothetical protein